MISHYDMITGEEIDGEDTGRAAEHLSRPYATPTPRLMTVQEAVATELQTTSRSRAIAMLPIETLLADWD